MGAVNKIPGVSGGTVAFVTGIYEDLINSIKKHNKDKKRVREVIIFVKKSGGIEYTIKKMIDYKTKAMTILENFEDSDYKKSLIKMIDYVVERKI